MKNALLVIGSSLVNAGVPNVVMKIVRSLSDKYRFDIIVGSSELGYYDGEFLSYGGEIFRYDKYVYNDGMVKYFKGGKQLYKVVDSVLSQKKYDIIHCHNGEWSGWALKAAYEHNVPVRISHSHGTYLVRGKNIPARMYKKSCMKKIGKYATKLFACSDMAGKTLFLGRDFESILNPIDADTYSAVKKRPHDSINLIQIGYYCQLKNQLFTLDVLNELLSMGKNAKLWYIGYDNGSGYEKKVVDKIKKSGLSERVKMLPPDYDKLSILPEMDFLMLPSSSEGLPLTALEAQASRVFCIASDRVPEDSDMGLFTRIDVDLPESARKWAEWIAANRNYLEKYSLNIEKISALNIGRWIDNIAHEYNLCSVQKSSGGGTVIESN